MIPKRIIVVGGGISGLAVAHRLCELSSEQQIPVKITVLEASDQLGGVISSQRRDGFLLEGGPDSFISEKPAALNLARRLGIESEIIPTEESHRQSFVVRDGCLVPVPKGLYLIAPTKLANFFGSQLLSWPGKLRMAAETFVPKRNDDSDESVASFVRRRFGREALERIGQPMISGIYSADPERLSLQATFPKFQELEHRYGSIIGAFRAKEKEDHAANKASGPRYSLFLSFRDGMGTLVEALVRRLSDVTISCDTRVTRIEPVGAGLAWPPSLWRLPARSSDGRPQGAPLRITIETGEILEADAVCLAVRSHEAARLTRSFNPGLSGLLDSIDYESVATVHVVLKASDIPSRYSGFGFVVPKIENRGIIGCTFSSMKFRGRAPCDFVLLRAFVGGALHRDVYERDDQALTKSVLTELGLILRITVKPHCVFIHRFPRSMPQYHVGHLARVAAIREQLKQHPNLFLTGNAYRGIGIPDCIEQAEKAAEKIISGMVSVSSGCVGARFIAPATPPGGQTDDTGTIPPKDVAENGALRTRSIHEF